MTDRINGFRVLLDEPRRDDDAEVLANAIRMLKGVLSVEPYMSEPSDSLAAMRERMQIKQALHDFADDL